MIKHISLFSGIGGAEAALDASDVEHDHTCGGLSLSLKLIGYTSTFGVLME